MIPLNEAAYSIFFGEINSVIYAVYETFEDSKGTYMSEYAKVAVTKEKACHLYQ